MDKDTKYKVEAAYNEALASKRLLANPTGDTMSKTLELDKRLERIMVTLSGLLQVNLVA